MLYPQVGEPAGVERRWGCTPAGGRRVDSHRESSGTGRAELIIKTLRITDRSTRTLQVKTEVKGDTPRHSADSLIELIGRAGQNAVFGGTSNPSFIQFSSRIVSQTIP